jgi:hypothetical protein
MRLVHISGLLLFAAIAGVSEAPAQLAVSVMVAPPVLPVYEQPPIPGPGYIWTPGYWAYADDGYYWVPGTWVLPPTVGLLWTPGYWGWGDGIYLWHAGYWGPRIGFYGGINYGFGYTGVGYAGGFWRGGVFTYNRTVNNINNVAITSTYSKTVINNNVTNVTNVSFNGGTGGTTAKATQQELAAANDQHAPATAAQTQHQSGASTNKAMYASNNNGHPQVAATSHAGQFSGAGTVSAKTVTGAASNNPAAGAGTKGSTGAGNFTSAKQASGASGASGIDGGPKASNTTSHSVSGTGQNGTGQVHTGQAGAGLGGPGSGGGGPGNGRGPGGGGQARFAGGGGPAGPKTGNFVRPNAQNFGPPRVARAGGGPGGPHPGKGPPPHH